MTEEKLYAGVPTVHDEGNAALLQLVAAPSAKPGVPLQAALQLMIKQGQDENAALQQVCNRVLAGTPAPRI